jgi:transcriptional regulator with XRE-family HTH domain
MPREYRHIKMYEKEIFELKEQGLSQRQIAEKLGFSYEKMHDFFKRHNRKQRKLSESEELKRPGRPRKDGTELPPSVQQLSKLTQLQYELAMKERHIKRLEMENELMRDFLSLTERK